MLEPPLSEDEKTQRREKMYQKAKAALQNFFTFQPGAPGALSAAASASASVKKPAGAGPGPAAPTTRTPAAKLEAMANKVLQEVLKRLTTFKPMYKVHEVVAGEGSADERLLTIRNESRVFYNKAYRSALCATLLLTRCRQYLSRHARDQVSSAAQNSQAASEGRPRVCGACASGLTCVLQ